MYGRSYPSLREIQTSLIHVDTTVMIGEIEFDVAATVRGELCQGEHIETVVEDYEVFHVGNSPAAERTVESDDIIRLAGQLLEAHCRTRSVKNKFSFA